MSQSNITPITAYADITVAAGVLALGSAGAATVNGEGSTDDTITSMTQGANGVRLIVAASGQTHTIDAGITASGQAATLTDAASLAVVNGVVQDVGQWSADTVSQAEAEAGTATTARKWTAERVKQAIVALASVAWTSLTGTLTLSQLNAAVSDATLDDSSAARTPTAHAASHTDGTDDIQDATAAQKGLATATQIAKLDDIEASANNYSHPNHSGDVTSSGDGATTIANDAVTNAKLANMAEATIKGRQASSGTGDPEDLTATQARAALGLGDAATKNVGTTAGTVAAGDDGRFVDARTPTAHAASHLTGGSDAVQLATASQPGLMSAAYATQLDGMGTVTALTGAEIKTLYEAEADTNAYTDAEKTKLDAIEAGANNYSHPNHSGDVTSSGDGATTVTNCPASAVDIDGATDIGANLADADLILVDDGAGGTNRKSAMSRVWTYILGKIQAVTSLSGHSWFLDEDNMASDSATKAASQQSIKAYVDAAVSATAAAVYPIGAVYINITGVNPATELGFGTWSAFGAGRVMVGYASGDTDFDTAEETGGAKTVDLSHNHGGGADTGVAGASTTADNTGGGSTTQAASSTHVHGTSIPSGLSATPVVQPYIVAHFWKRTA